MNREEHIEKLASTLRELFGGADSKFDAEFLDRHPKETTACPQSLDWCGFVLKPKDNWGGFLISQEALDYYHKHETVYKPGVKSVVLDALYGLRDSVDVEIKRIEGLE